ncbi:hypothetical protein Tco_0316238 [Tanacetum coccineum]
MMMKIIHEWDTDEDDSSISSSDEEDSDDEVEGTNVEGAKSDEEATYTEDQGNEAVKDTNTDLDGRDKPSWSHPSLHKSIALQHHECVRTTTSQELQEKPIYMLKRLSSIPGTR